MAELESFPFLTGPRGCPHERYAQRRDSDPLGRVRLPSGDVVTLATRYDDVVAVLSDPRFSRNLHYPGAPRMFEGYNIADSPGSLMNTDPPEHTRLRRLLSGTFTPRQVSTWRPRLRALTHELIDRLPAGFDLVADLAFPLPVQMICDVMGVAGIDTERVRGWSDAMLSTSSLTSEEKLAAATEFYTYAADLIAAHREDPGDGLLAAMIEARDEGDRLSQDELVRMTVGLFLAGHETTGSVLARSMLRLLDPRESYERLVAAPELIPTAVEELLRLETPGEGTMIRVATEDIELPSGTVGKGEGIIAAFVGANNDPSVFPEPRTMVLDRKGPQHITFGRGAHFCLGANLARMELQEILGVLVDRLPGLTLTEPADTLPWTTGNLVHRPVRLPVRKTGGT
ncbi:cytochrome P450 [Nonomuraea sp. NPDC003754]